MTMPPVSFILKQADASTRLACFDGLPSWRDLAAKVKELFTITSDHEVRFTFLEEAKAPVIITNEQELQQFYKSLDHSTEKIELVVQDFEVPAVIQTMITSSSIDSNSNPSDDEFRLFCLIPGRSNVFSVKIGKSETVDELKAKIKEKKKPELDYLAADTLSIWKLSPPIPSAEIGAMLGNVGSPKEIQGCTELNPFDKISRLFELPPPKHLHIIVGVPSTRQYSHHLHIAGLLIYAAHHWSIFVFSDPIAGIFIFWLSYSGKRPHSPYASADAKRLRTDDDPRDAWLVELHSKIWDRQDLAPQLFPEVEVTYEHYHELQRRLMELHPNRNSPDYNGDAHIVLSTKLDILLSYKPSLKTDSKDDEDLGEDDGDDTNVELRSLFPAKIKFLDFSSLELKETSERLPVPLLLREEYDFISGLLDSRPRNNAGCAIISGQPGTGKTAFLHLKMVQCIIKSHPFLYQTMHGTVYHVSQTVTQIDSWSSKEGITAFLDGDQTQPGSCVPKPFLLSRFVQIIIVSSPQDTKQTWMKQLGVFGYVAKHVTALWSPKEFFLTGILLNPNDLTLERLTESATFFGFNPRSCYHASLSSNHLRQFQGEIREKIRSIPSERKLLTLLHETYSTNGIFHSIFELSPADELRILSDARVGAVSPWALDLLLSQYETRQVDATAEFYMSISSMPHAESLHGRVLERQVLKYFDSLQGPQDFIIRSLADSTISLWRYPGPAKRSNFRSQTFSSSLEIAVKASTPLHLVPLNPNFHTVDSILYDPGAVLTCIQVTHRNEHPVAVSGLQEIQGWLKHKTLLAELRPSTSGKHWRLIFTVPSYNADQFKPQPLEGDSSSGQWAGKVDQYVLGIEDATLWGKNLNG
ncbi:hypothetical protein D9615_007752 [Tricholomella constricta]|uniref:Crinkler effector protein N-terminal domain-containing protein n=1 Tax=Tricholomella constricta TaxID=117010 RepID=A0A8H5H3J3_9AGAR|nr:hypothetical protein D9615_007752 [Tricholomella constricta]